MITDPKKISRLIFSVFVISLLISGGVYFISISRLTAKVTKSKMVVSENLSNFFCPSSVWIPEMARKPDQLVKVAAEIINTRDFNKEALDRAGIAYSSSDLKPENFKIKASYDSETPFLLISVSDRSIEKSRKINKVAEDLISQKFKNLYGQGDHYSLVEIEKPTEQKAGFSSQAAIDTFLAFAVTLIGGLILVSAFAL